MSEKINNDYVTPIVAKWVNKQRRSMGLQEVAEGDIPRLQLSTIIGIVSIIFGIGWLIVIPILIAIIFQENLSTDMFLLIVIWIGLNSIIAIIGGIFAMRHKHWRLAVAGTISTLLSGNLFWGIPEIILLSHSRKEFER
jgi:pheromone shutdown protein TraB